MDEVMVNQSRLLLSFYQFENQIIVIRRKNDKTSEARKSRRCRFRSPMSCSDVHWVFFWCLSTSKIPALGSSSFDSFDPAVDDVKRDVWPSWKRWAKANAAVSPRDTHWSKDTEKRALSAIVDPNLNLFRRWLTNFPISFNDDCSWSSIDLIVFTTTADRLGY